jgi:NAD(P)-dependent dehydrogenase (short-subunit alcohol dehydrogenase family)
MHVVVTGANRGIGLALVRHYLEAKHVVHATARDLGAAAALHALRSERLVLHPLDVRDDASCRALGHAIGEEPVDLLINNAGVGRSATDDPAQILEVFDTNAVGPLRVVTALGDNVRAARGKILFITSILGSIGENSDGGAYAYRMSKAALNMAGRNVAHDLGPAGVTAALVHPGWVKTDMGGPSAPVSAEVAASQIAALADKLTLADSGRFFHADGTELPW